MVKEIAMMLVEKKIKQYGPKKFTNVIAVSAMAGCVTAGMTAVTLSCLMKNEPINDKEYDELLSKYIPNGKIDNQVVEQKEVKENENNEK